MTRRRLPPDTRPKWDDPNLPVARNYVMPDGRKVDTVDPDYEHRYREHKLSTSSEPDYRSDPTYSLSRRRPASPSTKPSRGDG